MNKYIYKFCKFTVSIVLVYFGIALMRHGSSFGLELGIAFLFFSLTHWIFWGDLNDE